MLDTIKGLLGFTAEDTENDAVKPFDYHFNNDVIHFFRRFDAAKL